MNSPRHVKMALIWYLLPHVVAKQRSLPFLARLAADVKINCHALAVAKKHEGSCETVVLGGNGNRGAEHLKLCSSSLSERIVIIFFLRSVACSFAACSK